MAPNHVWATANVGCRQARRLMHKLLGGSPQCFPNGFTDRPVCVVDGFRCSAFPAGRYRRRGTCADHRRRIHGSAGA